MVTDDQKLAWIRANPNFAEAPEETLIELCQGFRDRQVVDGEELITQGERSGSLFLVIEGLLGVFIAEEVGPGEREVARLGPGEVCGEIGAVSGIHATATVRALSDSQVLEMEQQRFQQIVYHSPRLAETVLRAMARYL